MSGENWDGIERGEIRLNKGKNVLVKVGDESYDPSHDVYSYLVVEIFNGGQSYWLNEFSMGPALNEMEILALVAK